LEGRKRKQQHPQNQGLSLCWTQNISYSGKPWPRAADKAYFKAEVEDVEAEVAKGEEANLGFLERRLCNLQRMAPDILEVVISTLGNPSLGVATAIRKALEKAKADAKA
jgi:hypothetical protein